MFSLDEFVATLSNTQPPVNVNVYLKALWYDKKGDWEKAHDLIEDIPEKKASWIHAYLHRKQGDQWNADYWYNRAGHPSSTLSLEDEWKTIVKHLLEEV
ncbi:hypothetical protein DXN05_02100 [Deminuibacter soli]|uniref:Tetratricopeptide repeat protein n=2 Tax=Deminuibacter soli TaxID=2291815 RepID=A0A3E1NRP3_9BACT|nr:hypothetical protein DXN05_02100 [Deminuibacter soli]